MTGFGIALLLTGATLVAIETHAASMGMLAGPGILALGVGAALTVSGVGGGLVATLVIALLLVLAGAGFGIVAIREGRSLRRRRVRAGPEGLLGSVGVVQSWRETSGMVRLGGALWDARRSWAEQDGGELHAGDAVVVEQLTGLTLSVRRAEDWEISL